MNEKVPRCFEIGSAIGINFQWNRRVYHTVNVNTACMLAQKHGAGDAFALEMLARHNEKVQNPNDPEHLEKVLSELGVPVEETRAVLSDEGRHAQNAKRTLDASRMLTGGGVPEFFVRTAGGPNLCLSMQGSPVHPSFFEAIFQSIVRDSAP